MALTYQCYSTKHAPASGPLFLHLPGKHFSQMLARTPSFISFRSFIEYYILGITFLSHYLKLYHPDSLFQHPDSFLTLALITIQHTISLTCYLFPVSSIRLKAQ